MIHGSGKDNQTSGCLLFDHINKLLQSKQKKEKEEVKKWEENKKSLKSLKPREEGFRSEGSQRGQRRRGLSHLL